jgi:hypothetical protein
MYIYVICIYLYWWPTRFPYQMVFVSFSISTSGVTCEAGNGNLFCVVFCRSLFVLFHLATALSVLPFTASGVFKLFFVQRRD